MNVSAARRPPGPEQKFRAGDDLLNWMDQQFKIYGDTYSARVYGANAYVTREVEFAYRMLVENWQNYVKGQYISRVALLLGKGLMVSKGDLWKRQRRMIQPGFTQESVAGAVQLISSVNQQLLQKWEMAANRNEGVNVTHDVSDMALEVVLRFIFGDDYDEVRSHFDLLSAEPARNVEFASSFRALGKNIIAIIESRRKKDVVSKDILRLLMDARDPVTNSPMSESQLVNEALTLIVAGHETTASTLNWCWYLLSQHPEVERKLWDELSSSADSFGGVRFDELSKFPYARQVIEETMRLYPAGWMVSRKALRDDQLGEYFVPAGTEIYIAIYFMHRHTALWEDPDHFDPDRFAPEHSKARHRLAALPFSAGPRNCIGALFARTEMQIHLMTIASRLRLRYEESKPVELDAGVNLRSKFDFIMYPEQRSAGLAKGGDPHFYLAR